MSEGKNYVIEKLNYLDENINIKNKIDMIIKELDEFYKHQKLSEKSYNFIKHALHDYVKIYEGLLTECLS